MFYVLSEKHYFPPLLSYQLLDKLLTLSYFLIRISHFSNSPQNKYILFTKSNSLRSFLFKYQHSVVQKYSNLFQNSMKGKLYFRLNPLSVQCFLIQLPTFSFLSLSFRFTGRCCRRTFGGKICFCLWRAIAFMAGGMFAF